MSKAFVLYRYEIKSKLKMITLTFLFFQVSIALPTSQPIRVA